LIGRERTHCIGGVGFLTRRCAPTVRRLESHTGFLVSPGAEHLHFVPEIPASTHRPGDWTSDLLREDLTEDMPERTTTPERAGGDNRDKERVPFRTSRPASLTFGTSRGRVRLRGRPNEGRVRLRSEVRGTGTSLRGRRRRLPCQPRTTKAEPKEAGDGGQIPCRPGAFELGGRRRRPGVSSSRGTGGTFPSALKGSIVVREVCRRASRLPPPLHPKGDLLWEM